MRGSVGTAVLSLGDSPARIVLDRTHRVFGERSRLIAQRFTRKGKRN